MVTKPTNSYDLFSQDDLPCSTNPELIVPCIPIAFSCGVDEAGRGPLAGSVYAAAVILNPDKSIVGLADSKKLTSQKRDELYSIIVENALAYAVSYASVDEIDSLNILQATLLAMQRAILALAIKPSLALIDGNQAPKLQGVKVQTIIKGDATVAAISAASILAKVSRDREMIEIDKLYPEYGFAKHKGYGTQKHLTAINKHGILDIHRKSFAPIKSSIDLLD